jgi:glycosyltransferase involved in cell wall biosynthesis
MTGLGTKPTVSLDIGPLFEDHWTGIPVFTRRLAQALRRHGGVNVAFSFKLTELPLDLVDAAINAGTGTYLREAFERGAVDAHRPINPEHHLLFPSVKESFGISSHEASTVHDMSTLFMPENHELSNTTYHMQNLTRELETDEVIFCVSEATRQALHLAYPSISGKTRVLHQYVDWPDSFADLDRNAPPLRIGRYAAVVGTLEPRKNLALLLRALSTPELARSDLKLVVIGRKGWLIDEFLTSVTPAVRDRIVFTGFVSEFIKYRLLRHADFLIFPSLYEGFGIPALEAMSLGKPVLAARSSSFPEVIGDGGIYFDPLSVSEFAAAFAEMTNERKLAELAPKALEQARAFGWEKMAAPIIDWAVG